MLLSSSLLLTPLVVFVVLSIAASSTAAFSTSSPSTSSFSSLADNAKKFVATPVGTRAGHGLLHQRRLSSSSSLSSSTTPNSETELESEGGGKEVDIVLFGVGDLRTHDHGGLHAALTKAQQSSSSSFKQSQVLPLLILDTKETLPNIPGVITHTLDTAAMLSEIITSLSSRIEEQTAASASASSEAGQNLKLHVKMGKDKTVTQCLKEVVSEITTTQNDVRITVHVCDLGDADNTMGYSPFSHLVYAFTTTNGSSSGSDLLPKNVQLQKWDCNLRSEPWEDLNTCHTATAAATTNEQEEEQQQQLEEKLEQFPITYPEYASKYGIHDFNKPFITKPLQEWTQYFNDNSNDIPNVGLVIPSLTTIPTSTEVLALLEHALGLDTHSSSITDTAPQNTESNVVKTKLELELELNTGLYGTHYGGLNNGCFTEEDVLDGVQQCFVNECNQKDLRLIRSEWYQNLIHYRNKRSLEHSSLIWMMQANTFAPRPVAAAAAAVDATSANTGTDMEEAEEEEGPWKEKGPSSSSSPVAFLPNVNNLIEGEIMTRFLAAPLLFGTVSPRYLWHVADGDNNNNSGGFAFPWSNGNKKKKSVLKDIVEGREWHRLLAARNIRLSAVRNDGLYFPSTTGTMSTLTKNANGDASSVKQKEGEIQYGYWRWHGFLCRYGVSTLKTSTCETNTMEKKKKEGIVLVHGFGASGSQWSRTMKELSKSLNSVVADSDSGTTTTNKNDSNNADTDNEVDSEIEGMVMDLIGFGQSEKPPLTYTQYLWEMYVSDFIKEVALHKRKCTEYVVGGNSIGGYTSLGVSADDTLTTHQIGKNKKRKKTTEEDDSFSLFSTSSSSSASFLSASGAPGTGKCKGLVLMNSAGRLQSREEVEKLRQGNGKTNGENYSLKTVAEITASDLLPKCSPPPRGITTLGGNGLLWYLRPRIQSICTNLYPTNVAAVDDILCGSILRDSLDPGAINVMISGSKLPPPRTANELLGADFGSAKDCATNNDEAADDIREGMWKGPVLVAQGMLDPLNDAVGRAKVFGSLREGITVNPINGGHCPHDEMPEDVAKAIVGWMKENFRRANKVTTTSESSSTAAPVDVETGALN